MDQKQGQIKAMLSALQEETGKLKVAQNKLVEVLSPIVRDDYQNTCTSKDPNEPEKLAPLAEELKVVVSELQEMNKVYEDLMPRIEL